MFKLELSTDNAAFAGDPQARASEIARILHRLAQHIEGNAHYYAEGGDDSLIDANGNTVGTWSLVVDSDETEG